MPGKDSTPGSVCNATTKKPIQFMEPQVGLWSVNKPNFQFNLNFAIGSTIKCFYLAWNQPGRLSPIRHLSTSL